MRKDSAEDPKPGGGCGDILGKKFPSPRGQGYCGHKASSEMVFGKLGGGSGKEGPPSRRAVWTTAKYQSAKNT